MDINEDFYELVQLSSNEFEYNTALPDRYIEDWLYDHFDEGEDFIFYSTSVGTHIMCAIGTHACTIKVKFLNNEAAMAFKLRWA